MAEVGTIVRREFELGALSTGAHRFYERLGWQRWRGPTFVGDVRSDEEDDGVMVLAVTPVDLGAPISCDPRRGDDW
jgi:aminoglycoside 2'-N-acetyltransferase I